MGRLFGERNLGNRQISAFKPTGEEENLRVRLNILRESEYALAFPFLDKQIIDFGKWGCDFGKRVPGCQKVRVEGDNLKIHFFGALHPCNPVAWVASLGNAI